MHMTGDKLYKGAWHKTHDRGYKLYTGAYQWKRGSTYTCTKTAHACFI